MRWCEQERTRSLVGGRVDGELVAATEAGQLNRKEVLPVLRHGQHGGLDCV